MSTNPHRYLVTGYNNSTVIPARAYGSLHAAKIAARHMLDDELGEGSVYVYTDAITLDDRNVAYIIQRTIHTGLRYARQSFCLLA